ncbi:MAG: 2-oxoacid:ferredoxin oxidoreductase subunit beta [Bacteroidales bacterium]|nr:2-oxoacid:ferredoxin oxidoreductase subunit beta [Bacteroidales bacterium]
MINVESLTPILTVEDFTAEGQVKWCPGCGGHAVLASVKKALPEAGVKKENVVFVSGIGCSSRFPYYINTYGFHSLHGRAPAIASGIKIANPELSVWLVTGDGDSMAIGGNHFIHMLRRNIDVNILLFNNKIYGLTKGQYSPTTPFGSVTKTSPDGTVEAPFQPGELAMGANASFFARAVDTNPKMMTEVFIAATKHKGTSLVEVFENCVIFNNKVHEMVTGKEFRDDNQIYLEHGKPMIFGKNSDKGLVLDGAGLKVVTIGENGIAKGDILVHDAKTQNIAIHFMLAKMSLPEFPVAMGVIRNADTPVYEDMLYNQVSKAKSQAKVKNVGELLKSGNIIRID